MRKYLARLGWGNASMILGFSSIVLFVALFEDLFCWLLSFLAAILALVFGRAGFRSDQRGVAVAGLISGGIGLVLNMLLAIDIIGVGIGFARQ